MPVTIQPQIWKQLEQGMSMILKKWVGFQMAVQNSDFEDAHEQLLDLLLEYFQNYTVTDDDLADNLNEFIMNELDCELEDNSPIQVSRHMCELFEELKNGNTQMLDKMKLNFTENNMDFEIEDSDSDESLSDTELEPLEAKRPEPVIDEDGFELVQKGRRRR